MNVLTICVECESQDPSISHDLSNDDGRTNTETKSIFDK